MSAQPTRMATRADRIEIVKKHFIFKSDLIKAYAKKPGLQVIDVKCPVVETYVEDYLGLPEIKGD